MIRASHFHSSSVHTYNAITWSFFNTGGHNKFDVWSLSGNKLFSATTILATSWLFFDKKHVFSWKWISKHFFKSWQAFRNCSWSLEHSKHQPSSPYSQTLSWMICWHSKKTNSPRWYLNQSEQHPNLLTFIKEKMRISWRPRSTYPQRPSNALKLIDPVKQTVSQASPVKWLKHGLEDSFAWSFIALLNG